jgi:hypothetical protein
MTLPTLRALIHEGVLVVATAGKPRAKLEIGDVPANAWVESFVPYPKLLSLVDVMVTKVVTVSAVRVSPWRSFGCRGGQRGKT